MKPTGNVQFQSTHIKLNANGASIRSLFTTSRDPGPCSHVHTEAHTLKKKSFAKYWNIWQ